MSVSYVVKEGFAGLGRAKLAAFTSIFSLFVAVLLIGVLARIGFNAYEISQLLRQQVEVEVFLENIDSQTTREIEVKLENSPQVAGLSYISRDSASRIFQEDFGMGAESLAEINFLPASFRLTISDGAEINEIDSLVTEISQYRGVDEVRFNQALLQLLESRTELLALIGATIGLFILFVSMILVFNTIRLTIYAKRDLIRAMKLVGATNGFIRRPFLVEGILQGLIAGGMASIVILMIFELIVPVIAPQLGVLSWPFDRWYYLIGGVILLSVVMGWWGSRWAARKFIKNTTVYD
ncbi:MAG: permease-like cell division protein FtsX [Balneolaceae bacterium]